MTHVLFFDTLINPFEQASQAPGPPREQVAQVISHERHEPSERYLPVEQESHSFEPPPLHVAQVAEQGRQCPFEKYCPDEQDTQRFLPPTAQGRQASFER